MSHALRATVAQTRRRSRSGDESVSSGAGSASMEKRSETGLPACDEQDERQNGADELDGLDGGADPDVVTNDERRVHCIELIGGPDAEIRDAVACRDLVHGLAHAEQEGAQIATGMIGTAGARDEGEHRR